MKSMVKRNRNAIRRRRRTARRSAGGRFDPPSYFPNPWNLAVLDFVNTVSKGGDAVSPTPQSITEDSVRTSIALTMNLPEADFDFRVRSIEVWFEAYTMSNTGSDIANLSGVTTECTLNVNSLLGVPTSTATAPVEENRLRTLLDYPTRIRPAHVFFSWPTTHQSQVFRAGTTTSTNICFWDVRDVSSTGPWTSADQGFYWKYNARLIVLWRGPQDVTPTRNYNVVLARRP